MSTIPRKLPNASLADWTRHKPRMHIARQHMERVIGCAPPAWREAIRERFHLDTAPISEANMTAQQFLATPPQWVVAWDLMQAVAQFEDRFGVASLWNLADHEICEMAKKLAAQADELDAIGLADGAPLSTRVDSIRMLVRCVGIQEDKPIQDEPAIKRAQDAAWWRRRLRVHVARVVEAGAVELGLVHHGRGGYVSAAGLQRRQEQVRRNALALSRTLYRNEAGQVYTLSELAALGTANPVVRGGELMTRIRGAEEYAHARAHVGLFLTLTLPSRFHPVKLGSGGRPIPNPKYARGTTPRDGQLWLRTMWSRLRADMARKGIAMYGLRVAEPHHDATPHWHALIWVESEADAVLLEERVRHYWLSDDGDERGARDNRVHVRRMVGGAAAGYVAKYIAKSVGHIALEEHHDLVEGQQIRMRFDAAEASDGTSANAGQQHAGTQGFRRVDAWAATWGIRQFQTIGMPSVTVWRELRRVSEDQLELFTREGDRSTVRAHHASHRHGNLRADWRVFMEAMGGHALKRCAWHLRLAQRTPEPGQANRYGEPLRTGRTVGVRTQRGRLSGHWLVSRRMAWTPVAQESLQAHGAHSAASVASLASSQPTLPAGTGTGPARAGLPRAWTGFNNCTVRITHALRRSLFGPGEHNASDWIPPAALAPDAAIHPIPIPHP